MKAGWTQVTPSEHRWEREALECPHERLLDFEPYRAWANLEFISADRRSREVDGGVADGTQLLSAWWARSAARTQLRAPIRRFLLYGGAEAVDLVDRCNDHRVETRECGPGTSCCCLRGSRNPLWHEVLSRRDAVNGLRAVSLKAHAAALR